MHARQNVWRVARLALAGLALIAVAIVGLWAWQIAQRATELQTRLAALEAVGLEPARWPELCARSAEVKLAADELRAATGPLLVVGPRLAALPRYGPELASAGPLLTAAHHLGVAAATACDELALLTAPVPAVESAPAVLTARLAAARPRLSLVRDELDRAGAALDAVDAASLPPNLGERLARARPQLARARAALDVALVAPELLGADRPRTYLVVVQNPDELRPTGGFMSAAGLLRLERGWPVSFEIRDSAALDNLEADYPLAPDPLRRYMLDEPMALGLWVFRDANWSPDFPTSAAQMLKLYAIGQGRGADGVLAITPDAVRLVLAVLGPQQIEGTSVPVDAANLEQELRRSYDDAKDQGRADERKSFVGRLAEAMLQDVARAGPNELIALARATERAFDTKGVQLFLVDEPQAAQVLAERGWDGAVQPGTHDYLMVVSANVGYNKVGPNIEQRIGYAADLSNPAAPRAAVTIQHTNRSPADPAGCDPRNRGGSYGELIVGCYWNYLRVLAPGEAGLYDSEVPVVPDAWVFSGEGDKGRIYSEPGPAATRMYGALQVTARASTQSATFRYELPPDVLSSSGQLWSYRLRLQRQAGVVQRVVLQVLLPVGAEVLRASAPPQSRAGQIYTFELPLETDQVFELNYRVP